MGRREEKCFFSRVYIYTRTLVERQVFNFYTDDASIAVTSPLPVVYELPPRALPSDFLCHKLPRARRACNINKFSAEIRPRCAISARSAGDRRNGVGDGRVRLSRGEREREKRERETEAFRKSWASIPGQASRGGLKLLTRLSNSGERRGGKAMAGQKSSFRGYFAPGTSVSLSLRPLSSSLLFTRPVSLGNQSYFMTFSLLPKNVVVPFVAGRESFSCASEISNEKTLRRGEGRIFRSLELILN